MLVVAVVAGAGGCAAPKIDFASLQQPGPAPEMEAFNVFVGSWAWTAEVLNAEGPDRQWSGTARWEWVLDRHYLHGSMSAKSAHAGFEAAGVWSWHPTQKRYLWWMYNNWGYPQSGTANYDAANKTWTMDYTAVGLDGTTSYGQYKIKVTDDQTLDWTMLEWADALHLAKKLEMRGSYKRQG